MIIHASKEENSLNKMPYHLSDPGFVAPMLAALCAFYINHCSGTSLGADKHPYLPNNLLCDGSI